MNQKYCLVRPRFVWIQQSAAVPQQAPPAPLLPRNPPPSLADSPLTKFMLLQTRNAHSKNNPAVRVSKPIQQNFCSTYQQVLLTRNCQMPSYLQKELQSCENSLSGSTPWGDFWISVGSQLYIIKVQSEQNSFNFYQEIGSSEGWLRGLWRCSFKQEIYALQWTEHHSLYYCIIAFPADIKLYLWDGVSLKSQYIQQRLQSQYVQRILVTEDLRVLYAGSCGWVRQFNAFNKAQRNPSPFKKRLKNYIYNLDPNEYKVCDLQTHGEGIVFLLLKRERSLVPQRLIGKNSRKLALFSQNLDFIRTIEVKQIKQKVCQIFRYLETSPQSAFEPRAIKALPDNQLRLLTKSGLLINLIFYSSLDENYEIVMPPPFDHYPKQQSLSPLNGSQQISSSLSCRVIAASLGKDDCIGLVQTTNGNYVYWFNSFLYQRLDVSSDYLHLIELSRGKSHLRTWALLQTDRIRLVSQQRLADRIHHIIHFRQLAMDKSLASQDLQFLFKFYGNIACTSELVRMACNTNFSSLQTQSVIDLYLRRYSVTLKKINPLPYQRRLDHASQTVVRKQLAEMGSRHQTLGPGQFSLVGCPQRLQFSIRAYGYFNFTMQCISPLMKIPILSPKLQSVMIQECRQALSRLSNLLLRNDCFRERGENEEKSNRSFFIKQVEILKELKVQRMQEQKQEQMVFERRLLTVIFPSFIRKLILFFEFVIELKETHSLKSELFTLHQLWTSKATLLDFKHFLLEHIKLEPALQNTYIKFGQYKQLSDILKPQDVQMFEVKRRLAGLIEQTEQLNRPETQGLLNRVLGAFKSAPTLKFNYLDFEESVKLNFQKLKDSIHSLDSLVPFIAFFRQLNKRNLLQELVTLRLKTIEQLKQSIKKESSSECEFKSLKDVRESWLLELGEQWRDEESELLSLLETLRLQSNSF